MRGGESSGSVRFLLTSFMVCRVWRKIIKNSEKRHRALI